MDYVLGMVISLVSVDTKTEQCTVGVIQVVITNLGTGQTGNQTSPTQVQNVKNCKEISISCSYSDYGRSFWIEDNGQAWCYGQKLQKMLCYTVRQEVIINKMVLTIIHLDGGHLLRLELEICI